ncbi:conjugal transfer protein TraG N-terminal domain-containing protein [Aliarcobacter butzleri]|uniref:conjugal transfer protein TraG N-terminal domain-containing protein n=1 Tax=Aliarcobacter butzleri TaxID=28197 RepID=UPI0021B5AD2B|nr:conjugal transfer protein TraG N-terminal domain-containing protein [Aliarcobacter butzleri]MCT7578653.1 conjugal transfer protein TraG N-terminal domain-containing protein [Aliarcobacter butzleri]
MKKVILLLFILSLKLLADDDGWWIYTYEDVSTLKAVFNYLAMIKTDSSYMNIINTVLIAGMSFTIIFKFLDIIAIPKYFLSVVGTMLIVFSVNATIMVLNVKSYDSLNPKAENYAVIDNVPYIFAVLSSAFSNVGYHSALLIETLFTTIVNGQNTMEASFLKTGNLGAFKILDALDSIDALTIDENGKAFNKNMNEYLQYCVYSIAYALDSNLSTDIATRPDLFAYLDPVNSPNESIKNIASQKVIDSTGTIATCSQLFTRASNSLGVLKDSNVLYTNANTLLSKITSNVNNAGSTVAKMMTNSNLGDAQADITNYIMMNGVRKAFENSWKNYGVGASSAQAGFGAGLAEGNIQAQGKVKAKAASSMMPSMHSVLQAVMYVLFPLVLVVQLFAGGFAILKNYILGLLWLELWIPSYSVLNYFTLKEAQNQALDKLIATTKDGGPEGYLTLANQNEIYNTIANQAAIAADFYIVGIPALAGFILFASFQALSSISSGIAGSIAQYSSNQALNQERAKIAALDEVNEQIKFNNPLYTGNIGTTQAMVAQETEISQASKAAGAFLASGSTLTGFDNMVKTNMFGSMENMASNQNRTNLLTNNGNNRLSDGLETAINTSSIKTGQDTVAAGNLEKQLNSLGEAQLSVYSNSSRMEDLKTNIVSPVAIGGKTINNIVDGGETRTANTSEGKLTQTFDEGGKLVQSNLDGSDVKNFDNKYSAQTIYDTSNIKKADNIDTANNTFERINKTDTSNIKKADNIDTANNTFERINKTDTSNIKKADNIDTADNISSSVNTSKETDGAKLIERITGEKGEVFSTKITETTSKGQLVEYYDANNKLVKMELDNTFKTDKSSIYKDNNIIENKTSIDNSFSENNSSSVNNSVTTDSQVRNLNSLDGNLAERLKNHSGERKAEFIQNSILLDQIKDTAEYFNATKLLGLNVIGATNDGSNKLAKEVLLDAYEKKWEQEDIQKREK